jgi:hypothetical protein
MSFATAKPKAQPPKPRKPSSTEMAQALRSKVSVVTTKEQDDFAPAATEFAAALGWEGPGANVLNDIQVSDAVRFLTKTFHELHVCALNPGTTAVTKPTVESVCDHLNIEDGDIVSVVKGKLAQIEKDETPKPATPVS